MIFEEGLGKGAKGICMCDGMCAEHAHLHVCIEILVWSKVFLAI